MSKGTELVKVGDLNIAALNDSDAAELMEEALAGEELRMGDMERVKWPTGGGTFFTRNVLGNEETTKTITGVILIQGMSRAYFDTPEPVAGQQPKCKSPDGKWGFGEPGDKLRAMTPPQGCKTCPMAQFGSNPKEGSQAQACKLTRDFVILPQGGGMLPMLVSIPPASLGKARGYVVGLAERGIRYYGVLTELALEAKTSAAGQPYAEAQLKFLGQLDDEARERVADYRDKIKDAFESMVPAANAAASGDGPEAPDFIDGSEADEK